MASQGAVFARREQQLRYELVLNMQTVRKIGLELPQRLLFGAERSIA
jgi:hypothetical protein